MAMDIMSVLHLPLWMLLLPAESLVGGCRGGCPTSSGADGHDAGGRHISFDEVVTSGDGVGNGGANGVGQGNGVVDLEAEVGANGDVGAGGGEGGSDERGNGRTSRGVVQGAGGARENGGHFEVRWHKGRLPPGEVRWARW